MQMGQVSCPMASGVTSFPDEFASTTDGGASSRLEDLADGEDEDEGKDEATCVPGAEEDSAPGVSDTSEAMVVGPAPSVPATASVPLPSFCAVISIDPSSAAV